MENQHDDRLSTQAFCTETAAGAEQRLLPARRHLDRRRTAILHKVRAFMETKVAPIINKYWVDDAFPFELLPAFKELKLGGLGMQGYGCRGGSQLLFGLVAMEMARVDSSIATFFGVHNGLAMGSIYLDGSEEQKQKWLPPMARLEKIGCFGLTEPLVGSGAAGGLMTTAKREGATPGSSTARSGGSATHRGAISRSSGRATSPTTRSRASSSRTRRTPGFSVEKIQNKIALKVVQNGQITMKDVRRAGSEPPPGRQLVPRHRAGAAHDAVPRGLGGDRHARWAPTSSAQVRPGAIAVRQADRLVPAGAGPARPGCSRNVTACQCMVVRTRS